MQALPSNRSPALCRRPPTPPLTTCPSLYTVQSRTPSHSKPLPSAPSIFPVARASKSPLASLQRRAHSVASVTSLVPVTSDSAKVPPAARRHSCNLVGHPRPLGIPKEVAAAAHPSPRRCSSAVYWSAPLPPSCLWSQPLLHSRIPSSRHPARGAFWEPAFSIRADGFGPGALSGA